MPDIVWSIKEDDLLIDCRSFAFELQFVGPPFGRVSIEDWVVKWDSVLDPDQEKEILVRSGLKEIDIKIRGNFFRGRCKVSSTEKVESILSKWMGGKGGDNFLSLEEEFFDRTMT